MGQKIVAKCVTCGEEFRNKYENIQQCNQCLSEQLDKAFLHSGAYTEMEILNRPTKKLSLWQRAKVNVHKVKEAELNEEVREEYKRLKFESEKINADENALIEIQELSERYKKFSARGMGDSYILNHNRDKINEIFRKKRYHPKELKEFRRDVKDRT